MSKSTLVYLLVSAAIVVLVYIGYAYRNHNGGPELTKALEAVVGIYSLGGAMRIYYLVFWEQPPSLGNEDLVCLFVGAIALTWCSVVQTHKPFGIKFKTSSGSSPSA